MYYVPNLGPSIYMTPEAKAWAERVGQEIQKAEYVDLDKARAFADRIGSVVEDAAGEVVHDGRPAARART